MSTKKATKMPAAQEKKERKPQYKTALEAAEAHVTRLRSVSAAIKGFTSVVDHGGEKVVTGNGALRETAAGKGRFDLIPAYPLKRLAMHYEHGAVKYAPHNWQKGLPLSRFVDSTERHINSFKDGDRTEDHLAAVLWNIAGYMWTEREILEGRLPAELSDVRWDPSITGFAPVEPQ